MLTIFQTIYLTYLSYYGKEEKFIRNLFPGDTFGELALMYNAPRSATIKAKTACKLWGLDRQTFSFIVKDTTL